jgi:hypothetical protein
LAALDVESKQMVDETHIRGFVGVEIDHIKRLAAEEDNTKL